MRNYIAAAFAVTILTVVDASAAVYMWEDDNGVTGFTEDPGTIPQKYRKRAKLLGQDQGSENETAPTENTPGKNTVKAPAPDASGVVVNPVPAKEQKKLYGGKDELYWQNGFGKLKDELRSYRDQLAAINVMLSNTAQLSRTDYRSLDLNRKLLEEQEAAARKKLESFSGDADRAGVPSELR